MNATPQKRMRMAQAVLYAVASALGAIALMWILTPTLLRFQVDFVGVPESELDPRVVALIRALYKIIGFSTLALGLGIALLTRGPFRAGDPRVRWAVVLMAGVWGVPYAVGAYRIGSPTFVVPLFLALAAVVVVAIAPRAGEAEEVVGA